MAHLQVSDGVSAFKDKLVERMVAGGYDRTFAEKTFGQREGLGSRGFGRRGEQFWPTSR